MCTATQARFSRLTVAPRKRQHCVLDALGRRPVETQKKLVLGQPAHVWQWPLSKKVVTTVCPLHFDTKSEQSRLR